MRRRKEGGVTSTRTIHPSTQKTKLFCKVSSGVYEHGGERSTDNFDAKQRCAFLPGTSQRSGSERPAVLSVFNRMASLCISGTDDVAGAPNTLLN